MLHLLLAVYILALLTGSASVVLAAFLYIRYRNRGILFYGLFLLSLTGFLFSFALKVYQQAGGFGESALIRYLFLALQSVGGLLMVLGLPRLCHILTGQNFGKRKTVLFFIIAGFTLAGILALFIQPESRLPFFILAPCMYGTIAYSLLFLFLYRKAVRDKRLRQAFKVFNRISFVFFPLFIVDILDGILFQLPFHIPGGNFSLILYFLIITALSIRFALHYFNHPGYLNNGVPSRYFCETYGITEREGEVITHLLRGLSNKEISAQLCISFKTVENHIYSVYQKTLVSNRVELFNLLLSNQ